MLILPDDTVRHILMYCTERDVVNFSLVSREWTNLTKEDNIWKPFYEQHWNYCNYKPSLESTDSWFEKYKYALQKNSKSMHGYSTGFHNFYTGRSPSWPLTPLWSHRSKSNISKNSLVCDGEYIFFIEMENLVCLDANGSDIWTVHEKFLGDRELIQIYPQMRILICHIGNQGIMATDMRGNQLWKYTKEDSIRISRFVIRHDVIIFNITIQVKRKALTTIYGIKIQDGSVLWQVELPDHVILSDVCVSDHDYVLFTVDMAADLLCMRFKHGFHIQPKYGFLTISNELIITHLVFSYPQVLIHGQDVILDDQDDEQANKFLLFCDIEQRTCEKVAKVNLSIDSAYEPDQQWFYYALNRAGPSHHAVNCKAIDKKQLLRAKPTGQDGFIKRDNVQDAYMRWGTKSTRNYMELSRAKLTNYVLTSDFFYVLDRVAETRIVDEDHVKEGGAHVKIVADSGLIAMKKKDFDWEFCAPVVNSCEFVTEQDLSDPDISRLFLWNDVAYVISKGGLIYAFKSLDQ